MNQTQIDAFDTHDRLGDFKKKNNDSIVDQVNQLIAQRPFDDEPFYIFAHKRSVDFHEQALYLQAGIPINRLPSHRIVWQPRLQKPKAQTNSMLFKVDPSFPDQVKIIWILPERDQWPAYQKGKICEDSITIESIDAFENDRARLEHPEPDDPSDEKAQAIYKKLYPKLWHKLFSNNS